MEEAKKEVKQEVKAEQPKPVVDAGTLMLCVWVLYKLNVLTRIQVRECLQIIKDGKWPEDVVKYLQEEVAKI